MWPFSSSNRRAVALEDTVRELTKLVNVLEEDLQALKAQHLSLRGRVYALWGKEKGTGGTADVAEPGAAGSPTAARKLSKDELRRLAGLQAGKPVKHTDTNTTDNPREE